MPRSSMHKRWLTLLVVLFSLGCHPKRVVEPKAVSEPPPSAEVVATVSPHGVAPLPGLANDDGPPTVVQVGPEGTVDRQPELFIRFSHAMQPVDVGPAAPRFELDPPVPGKMRWVDPYRVAFTLDYALPTATEYRVRVSGDLVSAAGVPVPVDTRFSFDTIRPGLEIQLLDNPWYGADQAQHWQSRFLVRPQVRLSAAVLRKHVRALVRPVDNKEAPREVDVVVRPPTVAESEEDSWMNKRDLVVLPRGHWPAAHEIELVVDKDLPLGGRLPIGRDTSLVMTTQAGVEASVSCWPEYEDGCGDSSLSVHFSNPVSRADARKVRVSPRPAKFSLKMWSDEEFVSSIEILGKFKPGTSYLVTAKPSLRDGHDQPLVEPLRHRVDVVLPPPQIRLVGSHGTLPAKEQRTVGLETRWVKRVLIRSAVLSDDDLIAQFLAEPDALRIPATSLRVETQTVDLPIQGKFGWSSHAIDLEAITKGERRPVLIEVQPVELMSHARGRPRVETARAIYQQTDLGAVSLVSPPRSVTQVTALHDAQPVPGVRAQLYRTSTGKPATLVSRLDQGDGRGEITLPGSAKIPEHGLLLLEDDDDRFLARVGSGHMRANDWGAWNRAEAYEDQDLVLSQVVTERPLYRPGEDVYAVGWSAVSTNHEYTGLRPLPAATKVVMTLVDSDDEVVATRTVATKKSGKYWAKLPIPADAALGGYRVVARIGTDEFDRFIRVKDFRTPTFKVTTHVDRGDLLAGQTVGVGVAAQYYFGGKVPIKALNRDLRCRHSSFRPPRLDPSWVIGQAPSLEFRDAQGPDGAASLDPAVAKSGRARLTFGTAFVPTGSPHRCTLSVSVRDVSMQDVGAEANWWVHPDRYVALRGPSKSLRVGDRLEGSVRSLDFEGTRHADDIEIRITHLQWDKTADGWHEKKTRVRTCTVTSTTSGDDAECAVGKVEGGRYAITARLTNADTAVAALFVWVGPQWRPRSKDLPEKLELSIDPDEPEAGQAVQFRVSAPYATGDGVLALMHGGIRRLEHFSLVDGMATVELTADQGWVPRLHAEAYIVRPPTAKGLATVDTARASLSVVKPGRSLTVSVDSPEVASPNEVIAISVSVADDDGKPTAANVSLWAVDEAVLSLAEPVIPDLVENFIVDRGRRASLEHDYESLLSPYTTRSDPYLDGVFGGTLGGVSGGGLGGGYGGGGMRMRGSTTARERFETTPIFIGDAKIPASGRGVVRGTMPENLTTFRVTAIASAPLPGSDATARFGNGEDRTRVTVPLALRAITPRVLRVGDEAHLAAIVDNLGGPTGVAKVRLQLPGTGGTILARGVMEHVIPVPAGGQIRVPFPVSAARVGAGPVRMDVTLTPADAKLAPMSDAVQVTLQVQRERTLVRRAAVYGSVDADTPLAVEVARPQDMTAGSGRVSVQIDASLLAGLQDVVQDLVQYPYGCAEQTSSGLVPLLALGELAREYPLGLDDVDGFVSNGIARLRSMQADDGGFGYWPNAVHSHAYATAYALWVLEQAQRAGYQVPARMRRRAHEYLLARVERWAEREASSPREDVPIAMAVHALSMRDGAPPAAFTRLMEVAPTLPVFARALLIMALHEHDPADSRVAELIEEIEPKLDYQAGGATVRSGGAPFRQFFDSGPRTDAMVLLALVTARPDHAAVEPLARGLMSLRRAGRLRNTQEHAYALLALANYARQYESAVPRWRADVWIDQTHVGSEQTDGDRFATATRGASFAVAPAEVPGPKVTLRREGQGRLYYRVGMQWEPEEEQDRQVAAGVSVQTVLRSESGVVADGAVIEPGTLLALDVTLTTDARQEYLAVDVPLPAGLEGIDTSFGKGRRAMVLAGTRGWWASHEEIRGDRALLFADRLGPGEHTHTIYLRATTPGVFEMPPTVAQSMYFPEIQGHTARRRIEIAALP